MFLLACVGKTLDRGYRDIESCCLPGVITRVSGEISELLIQKHCSLSDKYDFIKYAYIHNIWYNRSSYRTTLIIELT